MCRANVEDTSTKDLLFLSAASSMTVSVPNTFARASFSYRYTQWTCRLSASARQGRIDARSRMCRRAHNYMRLRRKRVPDLGAQPERHDAQVVEHDLSLALGDPVLVPLAAVRRQLPKPLKSQHLYSLCTRSFRSRGRRMNARRKPVASPRNTASGRVPKSSGCGACDMA
jgi:hypothetical protein